MPRLSPLLALALLVAPALVSVHADAQPIPNGFTVMDVRRVGDSLTLELRANRAMYDSTVSLTANDVTAALPRWERATWETGERANWTYRLLKPLDTVTIIFEFYEGVGIYRRYEEPVYVPPDETQADAPSLVVTESRRDGTRLDVALRNVGAATAEAVVVSVEDAAQRRIGTPYARNLSGVVPGESTLAAFEVPAAVTEVVVVLQYDGRTERTTITLRAGESTAEAPGEANVTLATDLPYREVDLGRSADFTVQVRNHGAPALVQLSVEGLPEGYSARFFVGGSAVPSLYLDRNQTRQVTLSVTVPNAATEVDRTVDFGTVAVSNGTRLDRLAMGLAVRGVGKLDLAAPSEERRLPPGGQARFEVSVRNSGTAPVFDVTLDTRRPYGWTVRTEPSRVDRIDPGETRVVAVDVRAPDVIGGGRYTLDVGARSGDVASRYGTLALAVDEPEGTGGGFVALLFVGLIAATLGFGAWWKWRR